MLPLKKKIHILPSVRSLMEILVVLVQTLSKSSKQTYLTEEEWEIIEKA